jgi:hypothetical protein
VLRGLGVGGGGRILKLIFEGHLEEHNIQNEISVPAEFVSGLRKTLIDMTVCEIFQMHTKFWPLLRCLNM